MAKIQVRIEARIAWKYCQDPKSSLWVGVCEPLALTVQAETHEELMGLMRGSVDDLFQDLLNDGELPQFMRERGWSAQSIPTKPPEDFVSFDLPNYDVEKVDARSFATSVY